MATRAAVVATTTAAAAFVTLLPATTPAVAPVTAPASTTALSAVHHPPALAMAPAAPAAIAVIPASLLPPKLPAAAAPAAPAVPVETVSATVAPVALSSAAVPTAAGATAMDRALGKIGAPYRWGASGPNAFDCSGLVNWAYRNAGVSLPRTSRAMSQVGARVAKSDLRPGDLVFFYQPVSHVGIYIGNGKIVHASSRKSPVKISDIGRMKFNSARRV
jgi:cell wall-associated NlpC family hydrolase